jgi:hypothetical protein
LTETLASGRYRGAWIWIAAAAAVAVVAGILGLLVVGGGDNPSGEPQPIQIKAPARGPTPAAEARNLAAWLRSHSR